MLRLLRHLQPAQHLALEVLGPVGGEVDEHDVERVLVEEELVGDLILVVGRGDGTDGEIELVTVWICMGMSAPS